MRGGTSMQELKCPRCGSGKIRKIHRRKWMRWLVFTRNYECRECYTQFMLIFGMLLQKKVYR